MRKLVLLTLFALVPCVAVRAADEDKWVTIKGKFIWNTAKGAPPKRTPQVATKDEEVCAKDKDFVKEEWVVNEKTGGITNVVVWLAPEPTAQQVKDLESRKLRDFPSFDHTNIHASLIKPDKQQVEIDQPCCRFIPHVLAARVGQDVLIKNSAPVPHNAKWTSRNNDEFNPLIPAGGQHLVKNLKSEKYPIEVGCTIHPWMKAWVRVFDHPYFAVTDAEGNFEIKNAPVLDGKLRLFAWQESAGLHGGTPGRMGHPITVKAGTQDLGAIKFDFKATDEKK
jgi:hypothetical protein